MTRLALATVAGLYARPPRIPGTPLAVLGALAIAVLRWKYGMA